MFSPELLHAAEQLVCTFRTKGRKLVTAESCTGGLMAALITEIAGASDIFERGMVTYSNDAKTAMLGIPAPLIAAHGAVSREVATAMAEGALHHSGADISLAITGIAGPGGGSVEKPVGLVYIASALYGYTTRCQQFNFSGNRAAIRLSAVHSAVTMLLEQL
jgi:nicotinamide-nucleotide amidase